jgi:superfamily II DNA or RNA helicase
MITSAHQRLLMQLPTGTGKSLMFGLMSRYINIIYGNKTVVVVPNEILAASQQKKYAPWASEIGDDLFEVNADIHYCTYFDLLTGNIPLNAVLFVDEIDSLFFADVPIIRNTKLISSILLLNKYKIIGMTATFRGK